MIVDSPRSTVHSNTIFSRRSTVDRPQEYIFSSVERTTAIQFYSSVDRGQSTVDHSHPSGVSHQDAMCERSDMYNFGITLLPLSWRLKRPSSFYLYCFSIP